MTAPESASLASAADLATFVSLAWDAHAQRPREVATALAERAATLRADADSAGAIVLAEHVWIAHLADAEGLERFLAALPAATLAAADTQAALQRARWVLDTLSGRAVPAPPEGVRWRALHSLWSAWIARGGADDALAMLRAEAPAALSHPDASARRGLAATCNNLAADLRDAKRGDAARDALMLAAASASRDLWVSAGTWVNAERADYQLARCHAAAGDAAQALAHAQACLATIDAHAGEPEADAFERFYAHEALARAHHAGGDAAAASTQRARMVALMAEVPADLRSWCEAALADFDAAG
jgi:hypothetical protein